MARFSWRNWFVVESRRTERKQPRATFRPRVQMLEDRLAPAALTVNSILDTASDSAAYLTLREAVAIVNSPTLPTDLSAQIKAQISGTLHQGGSDTIQFDPTKVTQPIVLGGSQLELSLPSSTAAVTIELETNEPGVTLNGNSQSHVFQVDSGANVTLNDLTIAHGYSGSYGGGIFNDVNGTLTVTNSTFTSNSGSSD